MPDLLIIPGQGGKPLYQAIDNAADGYAWAEPPPKGVAPAGALPYRRLAALKDWRTPSPIIYTVEIAIDDAHVPELTQWYAEEHLAMLADVPGCLGASRYEALTPSEFRFLACYRFVEPGVPQTPAWIAARSTPWTLAMVVKFRASRRFIRRLV